MHKIVAAAAFVATLTGCAGAATGHLPLDCPDTPRGDVVEHYHGTRIADPYRWMEDLDAPAVADWVGAQNAVTTSYLAALPLRGHFRERLTALWDYARTGIPQLEGGRLFYSRNSGLQRQAPVYMRAALDAEPELVLDPNLISADGSVSLAQYTPSPDAKLLAYALAEGGADWRTIRVRDIASGRDLADEVRWMRFSGIAWTRDGKGFFYSRYPEPPANKVLEAPLSGHALYYHRIGTPQADDVLVYQRPDLAGWVIGGSVTEDGRYLLITLAKGAGNNNRLHYADLADPLAPRLDAPVRALVEGDDAEYAPIGNVGALLYIRTDQGAPNRSIVAVDMRAPDPANWRTIVPEQAHALENVALVGGRLAGQDLVDVSSRLRLFALDGTPQQEIDLPGVGSVFGLSGRQDSREVWYAFSSPLMPTTVFRYDPAMHRSTAFEPPEAPIDASRYETTAGFATSRDGTRVPFFMTARKGLRRDSANPVMLYGYGGFSVSTLPAYRADVPAWLELGGVWVTANLRGGAEYGEAWHRAGMLGNKQRVFDDFVAVAQQLVSESITSPARLGMMGGSNGGLLVATVANQRPDLFAAALPAVGVFDMLRFDRFTGGKLWVEEYGSAGNAAQFPFLLAYSPLHNLKPGTCYPATLVTTADHDDRVVPSHSFKYTAALQAAQGCARPALIRVEVAGSHNYRPTDRLIAERADQWAFAAEALGLHRP